MAHDMTERTIKISEAMSQRIMRDIRNCVYPGPWWWGKWVELEIACRNSSSFHGVPSWFLPWNRPRLAVTAHMTQHMNDQAAVADPRTCSCHPDDKPPVPCPKKYALTHCRAADLGRRLRHAITTAMNDDYSELGSDKRKRHSDRLDAMSAAAAFLEDRW